jgi:hypothetical protein
MSSFKIEVITSSFYFIFILSEFNTTIKELKLIDKAATKGITKPAIAKGIVIAL